MRRQYFSSCLSDARHSITHKVRDIWIGLFRHWPSAGIMNASFSSLITNDLPHKNGHYMLLAYSTRHDSIRYILHYAFTLLLISPLFRRRRRAAFAPRSPFCHEPLNISLTPYRNTPNITFRQNTDDILKYIMRSRALKMLAAPARKRHTSTPAFYFGRAARVFPLRTTCHDDADARHSRQYYFSESPCVSITRRLRFQGRLRLRHPPQKWRHVCAQAH